MKIVTILGSPRKRGNTAAILGAFEGLVAPQHEVQRIDVCDHRVQGCLGCDACQKKLHELGCVQKDDAPQILERLMGADTIVYASPVYCWDFTAQMKALLDRHYCLVKWQGGEVAEALLEGKRAALLATCGGTAEENADLMQQVFERQLRYVRCRLVGTYIVGECTTPRELGERAGQTAARMARGIAGVQG